MFLLGLKLYTTSINQRWRKIAQIQYLTSYTWGYTLDHFLQGFFKEVT